MSSSFAITSNENTRNYNGRITLFVVLSCIVASSGGFLFGYDIGVSGGVTAMSSFLKKFFPEVHKRTLNRTQGDNYCKFNSELLTLFTSSLYLSGLIASLFASTVTRKFGRRMSILIGGAVFLAGSGIGAASVNLEMLILGRVLLGIGVGFTNQAIPVYLSELAPPQHRGAFNNGFEICVGLGILFANIVNYATQKIEGGWGWRVSLAMAALPSSFLFIGSIFLPETPNSIIQHTGDIRKAANLLKRIRGTDDIQAELEDLIAAANNTASKPFYTIFQPKYRPQLVMAIAIPNFQLLTGISLLGFYSPILFRTIGFKESASLMLTFFTRIAASLFNIIVMVLVDRVGRRPLFLVGGVQMIVAEMVLGIVLATQLGDHGGMSEGYGFVVFVMVCVLIAGFSLSWGPFGWLVPSEVLSLETRSAGQSIAVVGNFTSIFVFSQLLLAMLCRLKYAIFFFYAGLVFIMTVFVFLFLPEMKNVPLERIDQLWKEHWFWKKIVSDEMQTHANSETSNVDCK
ncbi:hexose carrier protein HEX6-like isoform X1 [Dioscorea cayenensis subsp. rotundata]|uniref:Hexose carrier protein HEX6-like isoform X1 n=1 Tax=Dioscorea cayennensis subsp. rotundata TaxID=55577 RepID=A0AB40B4V6_DIOCR|nr:hexose carrier protein HEX6-like isoform X1 [Dioscorea cayenensis subsp. rotundata]